MDEKSTSLKIMILDSERSDRSTLKKILEKEGHHVIGADCSDLAIKHLEGSKTQLVIIDLSSPETGGLDFLYQLRMLYPQIISIGITTQNFLESSFEALQLGLSGCLFKPYHHEEIRFAIQAALANRRLIEERRREETLSLLAEAQRDISSILEMEQLAQKIVDYAIRIANADSASFMVLNKPNDEFVTMAALGLPSKYAEGYLTPSKKSIAWWAISRGFLLVLNQNTILTPELSEMMTRNHQIVSSICIPIYREGYPGAVLNVNRTTISDKPAFVQSDSDFLAILASHVSVCLRNCTLFDQLQNLYQTSIQALFKALKAKDTYTENHSEQVARIAKIVGEEMGLSIKEQEVIWAAGILHDLGKIGTPEDILNKPHSLNKHEWEIIRNHPTIGANIIASIPELGSIESLVRYHHEWFNGQGYPGGLAGDQIPLGARILAVADAVEAMTSDRPYRRNSNPIDVISELIRCRGTQFDPHIVDITVNLIRSNRIVFYKLTVA